MADGEPLTEGPHRTLRAGPRRPHHLWQRGARRPVRRREPTPADVSDAQRITSDLARLSAEVEAETSAAATMAELSGLAGSPRPPSPRDETAVETAVESSAETPVECCRGRRGRDRLRGDLRGPT